MQTFTKQPSKFACSPFNNNLGGRRASILSDKQQASNRSRMFSPRQLQSRASAPGEFPMERPEAPEIVVEEPSMSPEAELLQEKEKGGRKLGIWQRVRRFFIGEKLDRKRLAALGLGAVASYGFVSNATYGTGMAVAWIAFVKNYGKSPLAAGQWKAFLAFYAGFWTLQNFLRPLRFTLALAMAPFFDSMIVRLQKLLGFKSKRNAFGVFLFLFGSVTCFFIFGSIFLFAGPAAFSQT